jgi:hypothetical protein
MRKVSNIAATAPARLTPARAPVQAVSGRIDSQPGRSIMAIEPHADETGRYISGRPYAPFVAHLIATDRHLPQTRVLRRATPEDSLSAYESVAGRVQGDTGHHMRRSV